MNKNLYFITGPIGVGKTTLINLLKKEKQCDVIEEFDLKDELIKQVIENTYGESKIDKEIMQLYTYSQRLLNFEIKHQNTKTNTVFVDRGLIDAIVFSKLMKLDTNFQTQFLKNYFTKLPDYKIILFKLDAETNVNRIVNRNREGEKISEFTLNLINNWEKYLFEVGLEMGILDKIFVFEVEKTWTPNEIYTKFVEFLEKITPCCENSKK